jgi:GH43 family beta-xylosidase
MKATNGFVNPATILATGTFDYANVSPELNPDPYVIKYRGAYYCYSSGERSVPVLRSHDLVHWDHLGTALLEEGFWSYWAPCVVFYNDVFYMYYSSMPDGETDNHCHFLKVAVSDRPEGPFRYVKTLFGKFSIDAHVVHLRDGWRLFYSVNDYAGSEADRPGTVILEDALVDFMTPGGKPVLAVCPTRDEEIFERNRFGDGRDWHTIEGAYFFPIDGREYLMYSGGAYTREFYFIDYAVRDGKGGWKKRDASGTFAPLLQGNEAVEGTGHNSVAYAPNAIDPWIVYHGRNRDIEFDPSKEQRNLRIDALERVGDELVVPGPTMSSFEGPDAAAFFDSFDSAMLSDAGGKWIVRSGSWANESSMTAPISANGISAVIHAIKYAGYVMEVETKWLAQHSGGLFGVYAAYTDERNNLEVLIDVGRRELWIRAMSNGFSSAVKCVPLESAFDPGCLHHLRVERTGVSYKITLDSVPLLGFDYASEAAQVGLVTKFCRAYFDAFTITGRFAMAPVDSWAGLQFAECVEAGSWVVSDDGLRLRRGSVNPAFAIPEIPFDESKITLCMSLSGKKEIGCIVFGIEGSRGCCVIKINGRTAQVSLRGTESDMSHDIELPPSFRANRPHLFNFRNTKNEFMFFVDGLLILSHEGSLGVTKMTIIPDVEALISRIEITELKT